MASSESSSIYTFLQRIKRVSQNLTENKKIVFWLSLSQIAILADYSTNAVDDDVATNLLIGIVLNFALFLTFIISSVIKWFRQFKLNALKLFQPFSFFASVLAIASRLLAESTDVLLFHHLGFFLAIFSAPLMIYFAVEGGVFISAEMDKVLTFLKYNSRQQTVMAIVPGSIQDPFTGGQKLVFEIRALSPTEKDYIKTKGDNLGYIALDHAAYCIPLGITQISDLVNTQRNLEPATINSLERLRRDTGYREEITSGFIEIHDNTSAFVLLMALCDDKRWTSNSADKIVDQKSLSSIQVGHYILHLRLAPHDISRGASRLLHPDEKYPIGERCFNFLMATLDPNERYKIRNYLRLLARLERNPDYNVERWKEMVRSYCAMMENPAYRTKEEVEWFYTEKGNQVAVVRILGETDSFAVEIDGVKNRGVWPTKEKAITQAIQHVDKNLKSMAIIEDKGDAIQWDEEMDKIARQPVDQFILHHDKMIRHDDLNPNAWIDLDEVISKITTQVHNIKLRNPLNSETSTTQGDGSSHGDISAVKMRSLVNRRKGVVVGVTLATETIFTLIPEVRI